jgi:PIN domain nuclease of toxin-antitoxin system
MEGSASTHEAPLTAPSAVAVLDASSLLAVVFDEPGSDRVGRAIGGGAVMSMINWAEALSRMTEDGEEIRSAVRRVQTLAAALGSLKVIPLEEGHAVEAARLRPLTKHLGLSLADRVCLALGRLHRLPVLTTDRAWRSLHISVKIDVIR